MPSMSSPPSVPSPRDSADAPLLDRQVMMAAVAVVGASLLYLALYYKFPIPDPDEGIIATGAERVLRGQVPFRDFFSELGPASFYIQAAIFHVIGLNVEVLRLTAWLVGGVMSGVVYLLSRQVMSGVHACLSSFVFTVVCYPHAYRVSHHWWGNVFLLLSVMCLGAMAKRCGGTSLAQSRGYLVAAGMLAGASLLAMQSKGVWGILMGTAFLALLPRLASTPLPPQTPLRGWKLAGWFMIGVVTVVGATGIYFATQGALAAWWESNFVFLRAQYRPYVAVPQASPWEMMIRFGRLALEEHSVRHTMYFLEYLAFFLLGPLAAFGVTAWQLLARRVRSGSAVLLLFLLAGLAALGSEYHSPDPFHLMYTAPLMVILWVKNWSSLLMNNSRLRGLGIGISVLVLVLMLIAAGRRVMRIGAFDQAVETRRGIVYVESDSAGEAREIFEAIERRVPSEGMTFFYPYRPELFFLTATRNPTRFDVLLSDFHTSAQIEETVAGLRRARPAFIFSFAPTQRWTIRSHFPDDPPDVVGPHPVEQALMAPASGYRLEATIADMEVWVAQKE